jgi:hypothetical protein
MPQALPTDKQTQNKTQNKGDLNNPIPITIIIHRKDNDIRGSEGKTSCVGKMSRQGA